MPAANVWIRKDDWDKWQALENKAEAISAMLNGRQNTSNDYDQYDDDDYNPGTMPPPRKLPRVTVKAFDSREPINVGANSNVWENRTPQSVQAEIKSYKQELKDRLEYNQDEESRAKIEQEGEDTLSALWAEYRQLTGEKTEQ